MTIREQVAAVSPGDVGIDPVALQRVAELIRRRGAVAQLCIVRHGQLVNHSQYGCGPDALFWLFSTSKPYVTILTHQLAERGWFDLNDPVAHYWPEFGRYGKHAITINQVLQHRTGFATTGSPLHDILICTSWQRTIQMIERVRPRRVPGSTPSYQFLIFGFILGEVIQRVTGRPFGEVLRRELLAPLDATDTFLGITAEQQDRSVPLIFRHPGGTVAAARLNLPAARAAIVPSAGISATAADVAGFFRVLLAGGRVGNRQLVGTESIQHAITPTNSGEIDRLCRMAIPWSYGFQLGGERGPGQLPPFGHLSTRRTFGHNGSNCCLAWADPDRDLAIAYLSNLRTRNRSDMAYLAALSDQIFTACGD